MNLWPSWTVHTSVTELCHEKRRHHDADPGIVESDAQAKALRLRLYVSCSECARLIDLAKGQRPARCVDGAELAWHLAEEHEVWLDEVLGITDL